jgi:hypothetical protein
MRTLLTMVMVGGLLGARALAVVDQPRGETPRATDLLRAERLAEEVRHRLELPAVKELSHWKRGGEGWRPREGGATLATDGDMIINVKPPTAKR